VFLDKITSAPVILSGLISGPSVGAYFRLFLDLFRG